jgi:hypothetical protein
MALDFRRDKKTLWAMRFAVETQCINNPVASAGGGDQDILSGGFHCLEKPPKSRQLVATNARRQLTAANHQGLIAGDLYVLDELKQISLTPFSGYAAHLLQLITVIWAAKGCKARIENTFFGSYWIRNLLIKD